MAKVRAKICQGTPTDRTAWMDEGLGGIWDIGVGCIVGIVGMLFICSGIDAQQLDFDRDFLKEATAQAYD